MYTHAEVSCCQPHDDYRSEFDVAIDFEEASLKEEVKSLILKEHAIKMLGLG